MIYRNEYASFCSNQTRRTRVILVCVKEALCVREVSYTVCTIIAGPYNWFMIGSEELCEFVSTYDVAI